MYLTFVDFTSKRTCLPILFYPYCFTICANFQDSNFHNFYDSYYYNETHFQSAICQMKKILLANSFYIYFIKNSFKIQKFTITKMPSGFLANTTNYNSFARVIKTVLISSFGKNGDVVINR